MMNRRSTPAGAKVNVERLRVRTALLYENEDEDENKAARLLVKGYR